MKQGEIDAWNEIEHLRGRIDELKDAATLQNYTLEPDLSVEPTQTIDSTAQRPKTVHRGLRLLTGYDDAEINELNLRQAKAFKDVQAYEKTQSALNRRENDLGLKLLIRKRKQRNRGVFEKNR